MGVAIAISGALIVREYVGAYTNLIHYKRRCDNCGYVIHRPISVQILPYGTMPYGPYHAESFVCPFCGKHQEVRLEG